MSCFKTSDADSPLISTAHQQKKTRTLKKTLRNLSCASPASSAAATPASLEAAVEWNGKKSRRRMKQEKKEKKSSKEEIRNHSNRIDFENSRHRDEFGHDEHDAWYGHHDDESVNFAMSHRRHHHMMMYGGMMGRNHDADRIQREIMMLQTRMMSGRMNSFDRYKDWRLDVDRMSYEELLELGDRIGHVNTGLREEEISRCLIKMKHSILDAKHLLFSNEKDKKCSICQEEFEVNDDIGKLECSHSYHMHCIKQWLLQKNACPVCKTAVTKSKT